MNSYNETTMLDVLSFTSEIFNVISQITVVVIIAYTIICVANTECHSDSLDGPFLDFDETYMKSIAYKDKKLEQVNFKKKHNLCHLCLVTIAVILFITQFAKYDSRPLYQIIFILLAIVAPLFIMTTKRFVKNKNVKLVSLIYMAVLIILSVFVIVVTGYLVYLFHKKRLKSQINRRDVIFDILISIAILFDVFLNYKETNVLYFPPKKSDNIEISEIKEIK